jgi:hypothetical protein
VRAWKIACLATLSCAPAPAPGRTPTVPLRREPPAAETAEPEPRPAPPLADDMPPLLAPPRHVACELQTQALLRDRVHELRLRPGAEPVMVIHGDVAATMWLAAGSRFEGALLEVRGMEATLRGYLNGPDVDLRLAAPRLLAGFVVPRAQTALTWVGPGATGVRIGVALQENIVPAAPIEDDVPCDALSIGEVDYQPKSVLPPILYWGELPLGAIPLARERGGAAVATLHIEADGPRGVSVHEIAAGQARVAFHGYDAVVLGWLAASKVKRLPEEPGTFGTGHGAGFGSSDHGGHYVALRCDHEVPVMLEKDADRATVGAIHAGVLFEASMEQTPVRGVRLDVKWAGTRGFDELRTAAHWLDGCEAASRD